MRSAYILFAIYLLIAVTGQLLQKVGMNQVGAVSSIGGLRGNFTRIIANPYIISGLIFVAVAFGMWLMVISNFKMSYIYPLGSIAYILMTVASCLFLGERVTWNQWLGVFIIAAGCFLLSIRR